MASCWRFNLRDVSISEDPQSYDLKITYLAASASSLGRTYCEPGLRLGWTTASVAVTVSEGSGEDMMGFPLSWSCSNAHIRSQIAKSPVFLLKIQILRILSIKIPRNVWQKIFQYLMETWEQIEKEGRKRLLSHRTSNLTYLLTLNKNATWSVSTVKYWGL